MASSKIQPTPESYELLNSNIDKLFPDGLYFDRAGRRINLEQFSKLRRDLDYVYFLETQIGDIIVVTYWLSVKMMQLPMSLTTDCLFETMISKSETGATIPILRYPTEGLANLGHAEIVANVRLMKELP